MLYHVYLLFFIPNGDDKVGLVWSDRLMQVRKIDVDRKWVEFLRIQLIIEKFPGWDMRFNLFFVTWAIQSIRDVKPFIDTSHMLVYSHLCSHQYLNYIKELLTIWIIIQCHRRTEVNLDSAFVEFVFSRDSKYLWSFREESWFSYLSC